MLPLLLLAQLSVAQQAADSNYSRPALRALVEQVARNNHRAPASLHAYTSHIETEVSMLIRDSLGREHSAEVEQMASAGHWDRGGAYDIHVIGYRSQSVGVPYSTLNIVRGWTVPSLYGERLALGAYFMRARRSSDTLVSIHPFAPDRDLYYSFSGGDTIATLNAGSRRIPIVRIHVEPRTHAPTNLYTFLGEIDVDADAKQIVRMRGQIIPIAEHPSLGARITRAALGVTAAAYIEFVNSEIGGKYWLPTFQRTEFQASIAIFGQARPVIRIVSNIGDINVDESAVAGDSVERRRVSVTWAPADSIDRYNSWQNEIGTQSSAVHSDDFADLAPDAWKTTGPPRIELFPNSTSRIVRFNRVEGLYLGVAPTIEFRSLAPGLQVGAFGGWAFTEETVRGGGFVSFAHGENRYAIRAERALASTNDFVLPLSEDPGFSALLGSVDNYDYVDRSTAIMSVTRTLGSVSTGLATFEAGLGRDHAERQRLSRGLFGSSDFLANRGALSGSYALARADFEFHPNITGDYVTPGIGGHFHHEVASGDLNWQRTELGLAARHYLGPVALALHADGGVLFGSSTLPPQQLFELGGFEQLPGYAYKQFAGDRAALFRGFASYRFNVWKRPIRLRNFYLPGVSPGIATSLQGGWTELSSAASRAAVLALGRDANGATLSTATNGVRATAGGGLTFFGDILHVGVARPIDHPAPWKFVLGLGAQF